MDSEMPEELPHIDEHGIEVEAPSEHVWDAVERTARGLTPGGRRGRWASALLGLADREAGGPVPLAAGSTIVGFHVARADAPRELALAGSHRFSRYALIFHLDELSPTRTRVRAETRAVFPGPHGAVYRALVIGTRIHVVAVRRLLRAIRRRAERAGV
jgi:hypothetical protein